MNIYYNGVKFMEIINLREYIDKLNIKDSQVLKRLDNLKSIKNKVEREKYIFDTWNYFRTEWINKVNDKVNKIYKSPELSNEENGLRELDVNYSYERNIQSDKLEKRAFNLRQHHKEWNDDNIIFSSGMAALTNLILSYKSIIHNRKHKLIKILVWGAYFETRVFLDFIKDENIEWIYCGSEDELCELIENDDFDILLVEPVRYDWDLDVLDISKVISSIKKLDNVKYRLMICDTTLISENLPVDECLELMKSIPYLIFVQFNSLLKLNQEGLEFSNAGLITVYTCNEYFKNINSESIAIYLRKMRTIFGTGLSLRENLLLDTPFTFEKEKVMEYSSMVFKNNELMAKSISTEGIFSKIVHPSSGNRKDFEWAKAPFVIFKLKEDILNNYGVILAVLILESKKRNLNFHMGSSFGFRNCRFEVIIPKVVDKKGIFKIAMGHESGETVNKVIELVKELSMYKTIEQIRQVYKNIKPIDLESIE